MSQTGDFTYFSQVEPESSQAPQAKDSEKAKLYHLEKELQEHIISDISRFVLFQGLNGQPIDKSKLKDVLMDDNTKNLRVTNAALDEARARLNIVGFDLKRLPDSILQKKGMPSKFKERYYVVNIVKDDEVGSHSRELQSYNLQNSIEKALLMIILGLIYCKGELKNQLRWLAEDVLYKMLHGLDENIPAAPDEKRKRSKGEIMGPNFSGKGGVALTPNVDDAIDCFVQMDYLIKEKVEESTGISDNQYMYAMGPRAYLEIGQRQLIHFCAQATGSGEPDASMLAEIDDEWLNEDQQ